MKKIDREIIALLRHSGRASVTNISAELGLARATVRARLDRLISSGEILGFTVVLKEEAEDSPVRGLMMIEISGRGTEGVVKQLSSMPSVRAIHTTNGRWDLIAELGTSTLAEFDALLRDIRIMKDIAASETSLLFSTLKYARSPAA